MNKREGVVHTFMHMTNSYKAYWLWSLLEVSVRNEQREISFRELCCRMIVNSWYPIHFFRLNFGIQDSLSKHSKQIKEELHIDANIPHDELFELLINSSTKVVNEAIKTLQKHVPYRFLSPWINYTSDRAVVDASKLASNGMPYQLCLENKGIIFYSDWMLYFQENYSLLKGYCLYELTTFLSKRNGDIPNILVKLEKPAQRESLSKQRSYWNLVFQEHKLLSCIYTNRDLNVKYYDADHFIPWSFTAHNAIWNLVPVDSSINSSKGNRLPSANYFEDFITMQYLGLITVYQHKPNHPLFEDYAFFGASISEIITMERGKFNNCFGQHLNMQLILAERMGFKKWDRGQ